MSRDLRPLDRHFKAAREEPPSRASRPAVAVVTRRSIGERRDACVTGDVVRLRLVQKRERTGRALELAIEERDGEVIDERLRHARGR